MSSNVPVATQQNLKMYKRERNKTFICQKTKKAKKHSIIGILKKYIDLTHLRKRRHDYSISNKV